MKTKKDEHTGAMSVRMRDFPEEERPRERLLRYGVGKLGNDELLAILLGTGSRNQSAAALGHLLLAMSGSGLCGLAESAPEELAALPGIGTAKACRIAAAVELGKRIAASTQEQRYSLCSSEAVARVFMEEMRRLKKEVFRVVYLNTKNEMVGFEDVSIGIINSSLVHPREVFRTAVKKGVYAVILMHNHPSGNPEPSRNDFMITERLAESGKILGIEVLDHIVIGDGVYYSFKDHEQV